MKFLSILENVVQGSGDLAFVIVFYFNFLSREILGKVFFLNVKMLLK